MSEFTKQGIAKRTVKYTTKDGEEKNRYVTVGEFWSSEGGNRRALKLYATLTTDEVWINIYDDEPYVPKEDNLPTDKDMDEKISLDSIPF